MVRNEVSRECELLSSLRIKRFSYSLRAIVNTLQSLETATKVRGNMSEFL